MAKRYVIGLDFGTDSVRALVVNPESGRELASEVVFYPRWKKGLYCTPIEDQFRQHPLDYSESMTRAVKGALKKMKDARAGQKVIGIGVDTTGSTLVAVNNEGTPLSLIKKFAANPNAMFVLWKDHTAKAEAERINKVARANKINYTKYSGGVYSSEWYFSKILHILKVDTSVRKSACSWVEHCDWITGILVGNTDPASMARSRCAAGHKAMWHASWKGLPDQSFLTKVDPLFKGIRSQLFDDTQTSDQKAGSLTKEWARKLGLTTDVSVAVGAFDAHMGGVGAGIKPGVLSKIIGTSTCDMVIAPPKKIGRKLVGGICGQVDGSIIPGYVGLEAGQSSVGDAFAWLRDVVRWSFENILPNTALGKGLTAKKLAAAEEDLKDTIYAVLTKEAKKLKPGQAGVVALDWFNGRRTPYADQALRGALVGMNLGTSLPAIYRAIVESVAFGSRSIVDRFLESGVAIRSVVACGGLSKIDFVMQVHSDVMGKPISASKSDQTCALGAAIFAAVAAGAYKTVEQAQKKMCPGFSKTYKPDMKKHRIYNKLYTQYQRTGKSLEPVMHELIDIQTKAR